MSQKGFIPIIVVLGLILISGLLVGGAYYTNNLFRANQLLKLNSGKTQENNTANFTSNSSTHSGLINPDTNSSSNSGLLINPNNLGEAKITSLKDASEAASVKNSNLISSTNNCTNKSNLVVQHKGLDKVSSCQEEEYKIYGQSIYFVRITYGEPMDCPSGCIYNHYSGIVEDNRTLDFPNLREDVLNIQIQSKISQTCDVKLANLVSLIKDQGHYKWKITFTNSQDQLCFLEGYALVDQNGKYDLSNLKGRNLALDCDSSDIAMYTCEKNRKIRGGNCNNQQKNKNVCLYFKADSESELETCNQIIDDTEMLDLCYYSLALKLNDPKICKMRNFSEYYKNNCNLKFGNKSQ